MEDKEIVGLFWERNEAAVAHASEKYRSYCKAIAGNILGNPEDAEECVSDALLAAWNSIPPARPSSLSAYLGKLTRNISINRYKMLHAEKRGGSSLPAVLDELSEIVGGMDDTESRFAASELAEAINGFLKGLSPEKRAVFIRRYWHTCSISEIAERFGMKESAVSMMLLRLRSKLRTYLNERGYDL